MNFELSPELQEFVEESVRSGQYGSVREVVEAAIARLMLEPVSELDEETLAAIERAEEQIDRGECRPWPEVKAELLSRSLPK
jgi:putative addiction module CopG family antidote